MDGRGAGNLNRHVSSEGAMGGCRVGGEERGEECSVISYRLPVGLQGKL